MNNIDECEYCIYNARHHLIVCALHPNGVKNENCADFKPDPNFR